MSACVSNAFFGHPTFSCKINAFKFHFFIQSHIVFWRVSSYPTCKSSISHPHMHNKVKTKVLHHLQVVNNIYFKFMLSFVDHNIIWSIETLSWEFENNLSFIFINFHGKSQITYAWFQPLKYIGKQFPWHKENDLEIMLKARY